MNRLCLILTKTHTAPFVWLCNSSRVYIQHLQF